MREIYLHVNQDGSIQADETWLGFADEHRTTMLSAEISDYDILTAANYCRFVFDDYVSEPFEVKDGTLLSFALPQCVMVPPTVSCQICGYIKTEDGDFDYIGKSGTVTFTVSPSQTGGSQVSEYAADNFEKAVSECEVAEAGAKKAKTDCDSVLEECESTRYQTEDLLKRCEEHYYATVSSASSAAASEAGAEESAQRADGSAIAAKQYSDLAAASSENADQAASEIRDLVDGFYTKQETDLILASKAEKQTDFELLNTVTADGTSTEIRIINDSAGNDFLLTDACVKIKIPKAETTANISVVATPPYPNGTWLNRIIVPNAIQVAAENKYVFARLKFEGGFIFGDAASANVSGGTMTAYLPAFSSVLKEEYRGKSIGAILITANVNIPNGSTVELWGRRNL